MFSRFNLSRISKSLEKTIEDTLEELGNLYRSMKFEAVLCSSKGSLMEA